jgi:hypothetical protein
MDLADRDFPAAGARPPPPDGLNRRSCGLLLAGLMVPALMILRLAALSRRILSVPHGGRALGIYALCIRAPPRWLGGTFVAAAALA